MRMLSMAVVLFILSSCGTMKQPPAGISTESFPFRNVKAFAIDAFIEKDYKRYPQISAEELHLPVADRGVLHLYSWQKCRRGLQEFTVVAEKGERGLGIFYFAFDKNGKYQGEYMVAGKGGEGGYLYETKSKFIQSHTLLLSASITEYSYDAARNIRTRVSGATSISKFLIGRKAEKEPSPCNPLNQNSLTLNKRTIRLRPCLYTLY